MRLDKFLSEETSYSRKDIKNLVKQKRVSVNGKLCSSADMQIDPSNDVVVLDGKPVRQLQAQFIMLHKPAGYVTATEDANDKTVMELIPAIYRDHGFLPIGRLDKATEGLLLFTGNGDLLHKLISPKYGVKKVYYAEHEGEINGEDILAFESGIELRDGTKCLPAQLKVAAPGKSLITVMEGKYHQVRRMMASRGHTVLYLKRITEGGISLGDLPLGECRELTNEETACLLSEL